MDYKYDITCRVDWGTTVPEVGKALDELNKSVAEFTGSSVPTVTYEGTFHIQMTTNGELSDRALYAVRTKLAEWFINTFPEYDIRVESIKQV